MGLSFLQFAGGNPGAINCLLGLIHNPDILIASTGLIIMPKLEKCHIVGTDLYVLWSDICNKDYSLMAHLCQRVPDDELKDACSKQDYSGRILLKKYVDEYQALNSNTDDIT